MSWRTDHDKVIDRLLLGVEVATDNTSITLILDNGTRALYTVHGDCCSISWIEHITKPEFGGVITRVDEPNLDAHDNPYRDAPAWASIAIYHTAWYTTKGTLIVEYRNESNGYYGGWLSGPSLTPA